ncbi:SH2 domain-containing protein 5 [Latimeria chalumnae]|uniref:SH2 domain-containing protein 5 n=1 Tax=Latimeria chalumnae TaxID=7897 RepID=UPI00313B854C
MRKEKKTRMAEASCRKKEAMITKFAQYVGSFAVEGQEKDDKTKKIQQQLQALKDCTRRRAVILKFSLKGVKVYSADGETVLMAHALRRIFYSTCCSADCQFAFVARNPNQHELYCHLFVGAQPSEVPVLNLLLCRMFQLSYLQNCPEARNKTLLTPSSPETVGSHWRSLRSPLTREPFQSEEVSLNINALVSIKRLSYQNIIESATHVSESSKSTSYWLSPQDSPYVSPTLVRKKAIRNKVIRSGAYRSINYASQLQRSVHESFLHPWRCGESESCQFIHFPKNEDLLMEAVWSFAGISRECGEALLKQDVLGSFMLWETPEKINCWSLTVRTPFGIIVYQIYKSHLGKYCMEHLQTEFPSMEALIKHHMESKGGLLCCLDISRINYCYVEQDGTGSPGLGLPLDPCENLDPIVESTPLGEETKVVEVALV